MLLTPHNHMIFVVGCLHEFYVITLIYIYIYIYIYEEEVKEKTGYDDDDVRMYIRFNLV